LADYLGIFEGYARKNLYPSRVVLLLDPSLTLFPVVSERWVSIKEDASSMLQRLGVRSEKIKEPMIPQAWLNIFSFSYFQESVHTWRGGGFLFKDGRHLWDTEFRSRGPEKSRRMTIRDIYHGRYAQTIGKQTKPDQELEGILEDFIRYLTVHHIQVTLCLFPFHPEQYKSFLELQKRPGALDIVGLEHYYHGLAQRLNLDIVGSYDPAACHLDGRDFYDGDHIRNEAVEKMFKQKGSVCSMPGL
jgi:hypothetical protein